MSNSKVWAIRLLDFYSNLDPACSPRLHVYNPSAVFSGGVSKRSFIMFQKSSINALKFCHSTVSYRLCKLYLHARGKDMLKNLHPGKNIINFYDTEAWVQWNSYKSPIILNQKTAPCLHQMTPSGVCVFIQTNPLVIHARTKSRISKVSLLFCFRFGLSFLHLQRK